MEDKCPIEQYLPKNKKSSIDKSSNTSTTITTECPIIENNDKNNDIKYNELSNDILFDSSPQLHQSQSLSTTRKVSSIPKSTYSPVHQPNNVDKWVYPSEQQYYNAMKRKGYNPPIKDMPVVLFIHNAVNEQGWTKIKEWEAYNGNFHPKLKRFMGRPNDMSPKARFLNFLGYAKPFDRHDWIIERNDKEIRYVIDFYTGNQNFQKLNNNNNQSISIYLDVRPAFDNFNSIITRFSYSFRQRFQPLSLPKWCLQSNSFFQRFENNNNNSNTNTKK